MTLFLLEPVLWEQHHERTNGGLRGAEVRRDDVRLGSFLHLVG